MQGTHRLGRLAVLRRIRSSRRWAGRAGSCSRLLARLPSSGRSSHVAPVLLARAANWGIVSWGGQAVTRRYWVPCTCVRLDTGFRTPSPSAREDEDESDLLGRLTNVMEGCNISGQKISSGRVIHCRSSEGRRRHTRPVLLMLCTWRGVILADVRLFFRRSRYHCTLSILQTERPGCGFTYAPCWRVSALGNAG